MLTKATAHSDTHGLAHLTHSHSHTRPHRYISTPPPPHPTRFPSSRPPTLLQHIRFEREVVRADGKGL